MTNGSFSSCGSYRHARHPARFAPVEGLLPRLSGSQSRLFDDAGYTIRVPDDDIRVYLECGKCREEGRGSEAGGFKIAGNNRIDHFTLL